MKMALLSDDILLISGQHLDATALSEKREGTPYLTGPTDFTYGRPTATRWTNDGRAFCEKGDVLVVVKGSGTGASFIADGRYAIGRQLMAIRPQKRRLWKSRNIGLLPPCVPSGVGGQAAGPMRSTGRWLRRAVRRFPGTGPQGARGEFREISVG